MHGKNTGSLSDLQRCMGYSFRNKKQLVLAITHSSYANERKDKKLLSNERLEFLGDSVLNLLISEQLYKKYPGFSEGELTKARSAIVCERSLILCANKIELSAFILLGKGEELSGGRQRPSILADSFEAVLGAVYLDGGIDNARQFVLRVMGNIIDGAIGDNRDKDYKTRLQEMVQRHSDGKIVYELLDEFGPDHDKTFVTQVIIGGEAMGQGQGKTKKESEQRAAFMALEKNKY